MKRQYKNKLIEISAFILIIVVFIQIFINSFYLYSKSNDLYHMRKANNFSQYISNVLHRTQQERGAGAGYLGKPSKEFRELYLKKIKLTDEAINKLLQESKYCSGVSIKNVEVYFKNLKKIRKEILNSKISLEDEIKFYSKMNENLLDSMGYILKIAKSSKVIKSFSSYRNFEMAKEKVGIERAVLSGTFSKNIWNKELYILYVNLLSEQKLLFKLSMELTNQEIKNKFYSLQKTEVFQKVKEIEKIALNKESNFGVNSLKFYNLITTKINMLNIIAVDMSKLNNKIISKLKKSLVIEFIHQLFIDILLVTFLFYTLFLFHQEQKKLFSKSMIDKLTNLYNREFLFNIFPVIKEKADREKSKVTMFFIDLDGFKNINDTYGHESGDIVLVEVANRLKNIFRKSDIIVRLGGDEFLIIIENYSYDVAEMLAQKIITNILKPIKIKNDITVELGVSIGIAVYPDNTDSMEDLIKKADEAMYFSKRSGKGIYTFYN